MNRDVIEIQVRAVLPLEGSFAVFLGNADKTFVIYVDESVGTAISMFMRGIAKDRPLTHDLLASVLLAFGAKVERVIINHVEGSVFHARMILSASNELHQRKLIELDARPSDSIAMAVQQGAPLFVAKSVWDSVEDVTHTLHEIEKQGLEGTSAGADLSEDEEDEEEEGADEEDDEDTEDLDPDDIDLDDLEDLELEDDEGEDDDDGYDDGYGNDDDDEGEEWKKK
ncbi:Bifunctional nuclease [Prosthecobacter debontii]|uniref:Bifunctional nuclease n=1 Tax=Prosthecobacter debontii TaxID=48467 RepID=A0A1T4WRV4_9BACT|nr:bifunctional nuclease family protein [Prosthecobacter debontii]SKA80056.1 Bifunctional nuclease [Prosthecobacter debontii]